MSKIYKNKATGDTFLLLDSKTSPADTSDLSELNEHLQEGAGEKHIPVIIKENDSYLVKIGEIEHPMTAEHYIKWIEIILEDETSIIQTLKIGEKPEAFFYTDKKVVKAICYCNLHNVWIKENQ